MGLIPGLNKIWKGKGQPTTAGGTHYSPDPTHNTRNGSRIATPFFSPGHPISGVGYPAFLRARNPALLARSRLSTRRPRPPVHRVNRRKTGSPVVSLRCPLRLVLPLSFFPFHSFAPQFAARCRRSLWSRAGGGAAALRQAKPTSRSSNSVPSHGEIEGSWSRYIRLNSCSSQSRFGFGFVTLKFVACQWFEPLG